MPIEALREALINALCHRWWEQYNLTISLAIYDDRIEIASPGQFPRQITPENIKQPHESFPHNLNVAEALFRMTYLENWGSGAKRIIDACRAQNVEEPTWSDNGGFITVTIKRPTKNRMNPETQNFGDDSAISSPRVDHKPDPSTTQVAQLINFMGKDYMTLKDIMELFKLNSSKRFRENYLNPAIEEGAIERLFPKQLKHPKQKYRLTKLALDWKDWAEEHQK